MSMKKITDASRGFTFIETLVWISIFTAAMMATVSALLYFYRTNSYAIEQAGAVSSAQRGLEQIMRTIREAAYSSQGAFPIHSIAANDFVFYADIDNDALIERVHFYLDGTDFMRGVAEATGNPPDYTTGETATAIAEYVRNTAQGITTFRYYDELGTEITNYTNWTSVRFVKATLAVNVNTATLPNQLTLDSSAAIRNLVGK
jgi:type II secretory pathway pseudopilin PulG